MACCFLKYKVDDVKPPELTPKKIQQIKERDPEPNHGKEIKKLTKEVKSQYEDLDSQISQWIKTVDTLNNNRDLTGYALAKGRTEFRNIDDLADYLSNGPHKSAMEKAWLIYVWITNNISYDGEGFRDHVYGANDAESVLASGISVCEGFAVIFCALAAKLGIECKKISGYSKAFGYEIGSKMTKENHAWNAINISNRWYYVESTWGSGYLEGNYRFIKRFQPYYFLTPPDIFIERHFSKSFQLQKKKITLSQFESLPANQLEFNLLGIKCKSFEMTSQIKAKTRPFLIEYESIQEIAFTTSLTEVKSNCVLENVILVQSDYSEASKKYRYCFIIDLPQANKKYKLELFGKRKVDVEPGSTSTYPMLSEYRLIREGDRALDVKDIPKYNLTFDSDIKLVSHHSKLIKAQTRPFLMEFISPHEIVLTTKLTEKKEKRVLENLILAQNDYVSDAKVFRYCLIIDLPEANKKYKLELFGKSKEGNETGSTLPILSEFELFREGNKGLNLKDIPKYDLVFEYGIKLISHHCKLIEFNTNPLNMVFKIPNKTLIMFKLSDSNDKELENSILQHTDPSDDTNIVFSVVVPLQNKVYFLKLFDTKNESSTNNSHMFKEIATFHVTRTRSDSNDNLQLVHVLASNSKFFIYNPLDYNLNVDELYEFKYYIKDALKVALVSAGDDKNWYFFEKQADAIDVWTLKKAIPDLGEVSLFVQYNSDNSFTGICKYICK